VISSKRIETDFSRGQSLPFRISRDHPGVASDAANGLSTMMRLQFRKW
jgi:hypothetical protein